MHDLSMNIEHVTRIEGHGNIVVDVKNGKIEKCQWQVVEAPRFFEAMVRGRKWDELSHITSRICGICSVGHTMASLKATEQAMGVTPSEQTVTLRKILKHAENFQSHVLHVGYLVLPDLLGVGSVLPLAATHKEAVLTVVRLHRLANDICDLIGGRTTHPISCTVNGFTKLPDLKALENIKERLTEAIPDLKAVVEIVKSLADRLPVFVRQTEYIGLKSEEEYAIYDGKIASTDTGIHSVDEYRSIVNEYVVPQSTAKYTKHNRDSYMVGALARFNLNHEQLTPLAKKVAAEIGLKAPCYNPYMNSIAQLVEAPLSVEECLRLIDEILDKGLRKEDHRIEVKEGKGVGAVDVPRGILFHEYTYDKNGTCVEANCVIPTNQNHASIQRDMETLLPSIIDKPPEEIRLMLEMLVRAYDPCVSCSTHFLTVEFI
ncbi:MAG: Ni/Fe hydrogenase subunit alpha [Syntrophales bacterium]